MLDVFSTIFVTDTKIISHPDFVALLRRPEVTIFADIIKIVAMFFKATFKNSKKLKLSIKVQSISAFFDIAKFANFW